MQVATLNLYTCTYAATYYATVAATDREQARAIFAQWLHETHGVTAEFARTQIKRQNQLRPVLAFQ